MESIKELIDRLNTTDECSDIEAKRASEVGKSIMETVCSFSNEPHLGGGYLLLGVEREDDTVSLFPEYTVTGIPKDRLDQVQTNISTQASAMFNRPVRPKIKVLTVNGRNVIQVFVEELPAEQKPLFFKNKGLPSGAYRRIGAADHQCTEDDLAVFYQDLKTLDQSIVKDAELEDLSETSIELYRNYRRKVNPSAEELTYTDEELLMAISAIKRENKVLRVTYTGLLTFGSRLALRRLLPMVRVDYIRTSTNEWIGDTDQRFVSTLDMRGSLLELVQRIIHTINDDLPKGFELTEEHIQANTKGLPYRVLREAVVNALIHRSYRENSPIQIIRYPNRIEIINPGFSLKTEEQLGEPGSINRNPFIAAIFHETNLAETKGSGIRFMQRLMNEMGMMPPTFESDRKNNKFTIRLLLHHLLNEKDLIWLKNFRGFKLSDNQKRILIFVREVGAVDNASARQINGCEPHIANADLRKLTKSGLLSTKGKNRFTYYIPGKELKEDFMEDVESKDVLEVKDSSEENLTTELTALLENLSALPNDLSALPQEKLEALSEIKKDIDLLPKRINDKTVLKEIIIRLCQIVAFKSSELATILGKSEKYVLREFIKPLMLEGKINYVYPEMPNHPNQAYLAVDK